MLHTMNRAGRVAMALCVVAVSLTACRGTTSRKPPVHLNWNMDNVAYLEAQEPSTFFADGRGMRPQVPGTIAIGSLRDDPHYFDGIVDGEAVTTLPERVELTEALLARGEDRYDIFCTPCHGEAGYGRGSVPARAEAAGAVWIVPSFHDEARREMTIGHIYHVIADGFQTMPAYARQIPVEDRWAIAAWVVALQLSQNAELEQIPQDVRTEQGW